MSARELKLAPQITVRLVPGQIDRDRTVRWLRDLIEAARAAKSTAKDQAA